MRNILSLSILCIVCDGRLVDIADWMKQEIFVRLSHDYFTKCQILQPMSYRWADQHNTWSWCFRMRYIDAKYIERHDRCNVYSAPRFEGLSLSLHPACPPAPGLPGLCAISPRHPGHWTLTQPLHSAQPDSHISSHTKQPGLACNNSDAEAVKLIRTVSKSWTNQVSEIQTQVSFSAPGQIFFSFLLPSIFFDSNIWIQNDMARRDSNTILK